MLHFSALRLVLLLSLFVVLLVSPVTAQFVPGPELTLVKEHDEDFTFGGRHAYTLTVSNEGASATTAPILVEDLLPDGLTYVSMTGSGFDCDAAGQTVSCERTTALDAGESVALTLVVDVAADAPDSLTNEATVSGGGGAVPERPASDPTNIFMGGLVVTKQVDRAAARIGDTLTYTITVTNDAATDAADVQLLDVLSSSLAFASVVPEEGSCSGTLVVTCDLGLIPAGGRLTVELQATTLEEAVISNQASAYARGFARVESELVVTSVVARPDIELRKSAVGTGGLGSTILYAIEVRNSGPGPATGLTLTDVMPSGLTLLEVEPGPGLSCDLMAPPAVQDPGPITCTLDELEEGGLAELLMTARVRVAAPSFENEVCLVHDDTDPLARPLCVRALVTDPGFNPPEDSLPPPRTPVPTAPPEAREDVTANPTATPVLQATVAPTVVPSATPSSSNQGSQIRPPTTGIAGLR